MNTKRYYHRQNIEIALYGMSWSSLWDREKRLPTLREYIDRVKSLDNSWFCAEYLPSLEA